MRTDLYRESSGNENQFKDEKVQRDLKVTHIHILTYMYVCMHAYVHAYTHIICTHVLLVYSGRTFTIDT